MASGTAPTRTILGPLTTTYTPKPDCTLLGINIFDVSLQNAYQAQGCSSFTLIDTSTCWPSATQRAPTPPYNGWGAYSPGLYCPSGYFTACSATFGSAGGSAFNFQQPLIAGETAAGCCPSGYTCAKNGANQTCTLSVTSTSGVQIGFCDSNDPTPAATSNLPIPTTYTITGTDSSETLATAESLTLYAPLIQLNWMSSDLPPSAAATTTFTGPSSTSSPDNSGSSSTGDHVGIGVGVAVAGLAIICALIWFILRQRRRKRQAPMNTPGSDPKKHEPELGGFGLKSELPAEPATAKSTEPQFGELPTDAGPQELGASHIQMEPVELPGRETSIRRPGGSPHVS